MLGLGSNASKSLKAAAGKWITTDNLVLRHDYRLHPVQPLSDGAASFNGTSDYISMSSKIVDTADATYCIWVKSTDVNNAILFSHSGGATAEGHKTGAFASNHGTTGKPLLYLNDSLYQYWDDSGLADDGKWHHWAIVVDVDDMTACKLYIDGVLQSQSSRATSDSANSYGNLRIGSYTSDGTTDQFIGGYMCNFGVWTGFLSQAQIKSIMWKDYAGLTSSETADLVSWWNLDSVIPDTTTLVYDNHHDDGDTLGSELLTDGGFDNGNLIGGGAPFTHDNSSGNAEVVNQQLVWTSAASGNNVQHSSVQVAGNSYIITFDIVSISEGAFKLNSDPGGGKSTVGQYSFTYAATDASFWIRAVGTTSGTIDNISLKKINGNTGTLS